MPIGPRHPASRFARVTAAGLGAALCAVLFPAGVAVAEPDPGVRARGDVSIDILGPSPESRMSIGLRAAICLDVGPAAGARITVEIGACSPAAPPPPAPTPTPTPTQTPPVPAPSSVAPTPPPARPSPERPTSPPVTSPPSILRAAPPRTAPAPPPRSEPTRLPPERPRPTQSARPTPSPTRSSPRMAAPRPEPPEERRRPLSTLVIMVILTTVIAAGVATAFGAAR